jgi:hypothetical protein
MKREPRNGWSQERRARQAAAIHTWRPWERSTGPRTPEGKERVCATLELARVLRWPMK